MEQKFEQNTMAWKMARLKRWNGSEVHQLMKSGRGKDKVFSDTALKYIKKIVFERNLKEEYCTDEDSFMEYDAINFQGNRYTDYGHDHEAEAAEIFRYYCEGVKDVREVGSFVHDSVPYLAASPDRIATMADGTEAVLEIKCPQDAWVTYATEVTDGQTLLAVKPEYYWQIIAEMACTGLRMAYICFYNHFQKCGFHMVRVPFDDEAFEYMKERIMAAEEEVKKELEKITNSFNL